MQIHKTMPFHVIVNNFITVLNLIMGRGQDQGAPAGDAPQAGAADRAGSGPDVNNEQLRAADDAQPMTPDDDDIWAVGQAEGAGNLEVDNEYEEEEVANNTGIGVDADVSAISDEEASAVDDSDGVRADSVPRARPQGAGQGYHQGRVELRRLEWPADWRCDPGECRYCARAQARRGEDF